MVVVLHAHPVRGESHIQRNTTGEFATITSALSYIIPGAILALSDNTTVAIGNPERHMREASHCGSKQQ